MFNLLKWFFTVFGIISFIICLGLWYGWTADAYGVRTATTTIIKVLSAQKSLPDTINNDNLSASYLTPEQQKTLEDAGIDPDSLPPSLTVEQKHCMVGKIGQERVDAISAGATLTSKEMLAGASCL